MDLVQQPLGTARHNPKPEIGKTEEGDSNHLILVREHTLLPQTDLNLFEPTQKTTQSPFFGSLRRETHQHTQSF